MSDEDLSRELARALHSAADRFEPTIDGRDAAASALARSARGPRSSDAARRRLLVPGVAVVGALAAATIALVLIVPGGGGGGGPAASLAGRAPAPANAPATSSAAGTAGAGGQAANGAAAGAGAGGGASEAAPAPGVPVGPADNGRTIDLQPGAVLSVALPGTATARWSAPQSDNPEVLVTVSSSADPVSGTASGSFRAGATGTATLSADELPRCSPGQACSQVVQLWEVTIQVTA